MEMTNMTQSSSIGTTPAPMASTEGTGASAGASAEIKTDKPLEKGDASAVETPVVESQNNDAQDFSKKLVALSKKELAIKRKEKELEEFKKNFEESKQIRELAKKDVNKFLELNGLSVDDILKAKLGAEAVEGPVTTDKKVELLTQQLDELKNQLANKDNELRQSSQDREIKEFKNKIKEEATKAGDKFELVVSRNAYDLVFETMLQYYEAEKEPLPLDKALESVEEYLTEEAKKFASAKKIQSLFAPKPETPKQETKPSVTLTNNLSPVTNVTPSRSLSREESLAQAAALLKWRDN